MNLNEPTLKTDEPNNEENDDIEYQKVEYAEGQSHKTWDGRAPPFPQFPNQSRFAPVSLMLKKIFKNFFSQIFEFFLKFSKWSG